MLIGGGFGTGKSHVLEHLAHLALSEDFVVSNVVISKETPMHDPAKVYRAAIESAKVPGRPGSAIDEIAADLQFDSDPYADLYRWVHGEDSPVDSRFAATLVPVRARARRRGVHRPDRPLLGGRPAAGRGPAAAAQGGGGGRDVPVGGDQGA